MKLNKNKGKWYSDEIYPDWAEPSVLDDIAYHLYCKDRISDKCNPQITFIHNYNKFNHILIVKYYEEAKIILRRIKLEKIINNIYTK